MDSQGRGLERKSGASGGVFKAARGAGWGGGGLQSSKVWIAFGETPAEKDWPANLRGSAMVGIVDYGRRGGEDRYKGAGLSSGKRGRIFYRCWRDT